MRTAREPPTPPHCKGKHGSGGEKNGAYEMESSGLAWPGQGAPGAAEYMTKKCGHLPTKPTAACDEAGYSIAERGIWAPRRC
jgi:hypothetical protein